MVVCNFFDKISPCPLEVRRDKLFSLHFIQSWFRLRLSTSEQRKIQVNLNYLVWRNQAVMASYEIQVDTRHKKETKNFIIPALHVTYSISPSSFSLSIIVLTVCFYLRLERKIPEVEMFGSYSEWYIKYLRVQHLMGKNEVKYCQFCHFLRHPLRQCHKLCSFLTVFLIR